MTIAQAFTPVVLSGNPTTGGTLVVPAGAAAGVVLEVSVTSRDSINPALGPTISDNDIGGNAWAIVRQSSDGKATTWWKRATSGTAGKTITIAAALGSCAAVLQGFSGCATTGTPQTNVSEEANASGDEVHAGFTPSQADSMVRAAVYNYANDNAVTVLSFATLGALATTEKLSTGGSDCACASGYKLQVGAAAATGTLTWAQTNGTTYSHVWALKPAVEFSGSATLTGGGGITPAAASQRAVSLASSGGGGIAPSASTQRAGIAGATSGGLLAFIQQTARAIAAGLTGGGGVTPAGATHRTGSTAVTAGGSVSPAASTERGSSAAVQGGGSIATEGAAQGSQGPEEHAGAAVLAAGGLVALVQRTARALTTVLLGGGATAAASSPARSGSAALSGGGGAAASGFNSTPIEYRALVVQPPATPHTFAPAEPPPARLQESNGFGIAFAAD